MRKSLFAMNILQPILLLFLLLAIHQALGTLVHKSASQDHLDIIPSTRNVHVNDSCVSISDCTSGLVCFSGNPVGSCQHPDSLISFSHFIVNLIQLDYTVQPGEDGPTPQQGGPTVTSRAMAIIYLAAHDAFGLCTSLFEPRVRAPFQPYLKRRAQRLVRSLHYTARWYGRNRQAFVQKQCKLASLSAGYSAARLFYSRSRRVIDTVSRRAIADAAPGVASFGRTTAFAWFLSRRFDGSAFDQFDDIFTFEFLRHQPDPNFNIVTNETGSQQNFGRFWGAVDPFVVDDVRTDAFLAPFPDADTPEYRSNLTEVREVGQLNNMTLPDGTPLNDIGTFWGYDSMPEIGVPPRLYLQVVLAVRELHKLSFADQLRVLTAVNGAMADAGIAAWLWKFEYDLWRPVLGIRMDTVEPDSEWNPFGVPFSNISPETVPESVGLNPNFPAYPSGHSTFGTAAFKTLANLLQVAPSDINLTITSDEFNGVTIDGVTNEPRRVFTQTLTLADCIQQNQDSRVFNGVHWRFDSIGGDIVGTQIADRAATEFALHS